MTKSQEMSTAFETVLVDAAKFGGVGTPDDVTVALTAVESPCVEFQWNRSWMSYDVLAASAVPEVISVMVSEDSS